MSEVLRSPHKTKRATTAAVFGTFLPLLVSNSAQGTAAEHTSEEIKLYFVDPQYDKHQRCYYETNLKRPDQDPGQFRFLGLALCRNQHERETLTGQVSVTKPNGDYFWVDGTYYLGHGHTKNGKYSYLEETFSKRQTRELYRLIKAGDKVWMSVSYNFDGPKGENGQDAPYADQRITAADVAPTPTHIPHQPQPIHDNLTPLAEY